MCRKGAWAEQAAEVTFGAGIQSRMSIKIKINYNKLFWTLKTASFFVEKSMVNLYNKRYIFCRAADI